jgi:hypothetical protein
VADTSSSGNEKKRVARWVSRLSDANKAYDKWYRDYKVEKSKRYWKGFQRTGEDRLDANNQEKVQVNLIAPTVAIRIPSLYFYYPFARVLGAPSVSYVEGTQLEDRAQLLQDTGNTIIRDPETGFRRETLMALKESMWAFGLIEIGYSAEFVDNPYYQRPPLVENEDVEEEMEQGGSKLFAGGSKDTDDNPFPSLFNDKGGSYPSDGSDTIPPPTAPAVTQPRSMPDEAVAQLKQIVDKEQFYVRHIPPEQFRVSISGQPCLEANDWCAYYEWMYVEDVKAAPAYNPEATKKLKAGGAIVKDYSTATGDISTSSSTAISFPSDSSMDRDRDRGGQVKVWKIWDLRTRQRHVIAEGCEKFLIEGEEFKRVPLYPITFEDQDDDWYPIPPIQAMLGPQDEYNDSREMLRGLRHMIVPRYTADTGIEDSELRKLETGGPGVIARVNTNSPSPIMPVSQPELDSGAVRALGIAKSDLMEVSGVSGEQRGQAEADTATQASIINQRALVRDSFGRLRVAEWLGNITRGLIQLAIDKMSLPMWVLRNCDPQSQNFMADAANISSLYREITLTDLKEADQMLRWDVSVDVETLSPLTEDTLRAQIQSVVTMLAQPPVAMLLSKSPPLLKICLDRFGIRDSKTQDAIRQALGMVAMTPPGAPGVPSPPAGPGGGAPLAPNPTGPGMPITQSTPGPVGGPLPGMSGPNSMPGGPPPTVPAGGGPGLGM